ncbi:hypothetical protein BDV93DRAFT_521263 [Ceratobasidium sp. AG-I]|nr:hypothetical protein BDV93DRAFT_521263 [Ceratobasidium sp. AG-I]
MAGQAATPVAPPPSYVFEPPPGGDISLRSADGKVFRLHAIILNLASSVFSDMLTIGTQSTEIIDISDDSEAISLMLGFIYPSALPPIVNTYELLDKSLQIARKYHVESMLQKLDRSISHESFYKDFVKINPLRLFKLCAEYGLRETQTAAARMVRAGPRHLLGPHNIIDLAKQYPSSSHIIGMLGTQFIRSEILRSALLDTGDDSLLEVDVDNDESGFEQMICASCRKRCANDITMPPFMLFPGWLRAWGVLAYDTLSTRSWDDSSFVFTTEAFEHLNSPRVSGGSCRVCIEAARSARGGRAFETWAGVVKIDLESRMQQLEDLYVL